MSEEKEDGFDMSLLAPSQAEAEAGAEPEPTPEVEPVEDEQVDEVAEEPKELPADEEPESDPKPDHSDLMDKEVQKLQQLRATYEREIAKLASAPTERQVDRVEKAKSKLDKYLDDADVDPYKGVTDIASEVMADRGRVEQLLQQHEADRRDAEEREFRLSRRMAEMQFAMDFPELKGQYSALEHQANEALLEQLGDTVADLNEEAYTKLANREFLRLAKDAVEAAKPAEKEPEKAPIQDTAKTPKAAKIIQSKNGSKAEAPKSSEAIGESLLADIRQARFGS